MEDRQLIVRYLLGDASDQERCVFEEKLFGDDEFFNQVLDTETDLMDEYAAGELNPEECERLENTLLQSVPSGQRLAFAKALAKIVAESGSAPHPRTRFPKTYLQAAAAILLGIALAAGIDDLRVRREIHEEARQPAPVARPSAPESTPTDLLLTPATRRAADLSPLQLAGANQPVHLQLDLGAAKPQATYRVVVSTAAGKTVCEFEKIPPTQTAHSAFISLWMPSNLLRPGKYEITLALPNGEPENFYYFEVSGQ